MFINPQVAIDNGWVTGIANPEKQIQPNALDFTLDRLFSIYQDNTFVISEEGKQMRGGKEMLPFQDGRSETKFWNLEAHGVYDGLSNVTVDLPEGVAAMLIVRSSLARNGIFLTSGLWDSGYKGPIGCQIHNRSFTAKIGQGTRIGQLIFVKSDNAGTYEGGYNHEEGTHWADKDDKVKAILEDIEAVDPHNDGC